MSTEEVPKCHLPNHEGSPCVLVMRCPAVQALLLRQVGKLSMLETEYLNSLKCKGPVSSLDFTEPFFETKFYSEQFALLSYGS